MKQHGVAWAGVVAIAALATPAAAHPTAVRTAPVATPFGWADPSWIHVVSPGQIVTDTVAPMATPDAPQPFDTPQPPSFVAWGNAVVPQGLQTLSARWTVPPAPASNDGQILYAFPSFTGVGNPPILQPVLQWGVNGVGTGGAYWGIACWYLAGLTDYKVSPVAEVQPGDVIDGTITGSGCDAGVCGSWTVTITDATTPAATESITVTTTSAAYVAVQGGVLEAYAVVSCADWPGGPLIFSGLSMTDALGSAVTPTWDLHLGTGFPSCAIGVASPSPSEVDIDFDAPSDAGAADASAPDAATVAEAGASDANAADASAPEDSANIADSSATVAETGAPLMDATSASDAEPEASANSDASSAGAGTTSAKGCGCAAVGSSSSRIPPAPAAALSLTMSAVIAARRRRRSRRGL